ncbi:MAG TPA: DUF6249 domain-containing protein [Gammaproteobacteria bacterium]|nr:DUF6249 domain-containing protein [Gammaproteobacteria bacterium]
MAKKLALTGVAGTPILSLAQAVPEGMDPETYEQFLLASAQMENPFAGQAYALMIGLIVIIVAAMYFASQREKRKQDLFVQFLDKGQSIPQEILPPMPSRQRELRRGVWLLFLGIGLGLVLYISSREWGNAAWSLILLFPAAASFVNAALFYGSPRSGGQSGNGD